MKSFVLGAVAGSALAVMVAACAQPAYFPAENIDPARHGNLAAAQDLVTQAFERLSDAQRANHGHLGGHGERAKDLLREANDEIKQAAIFINRR